LLIAFRNAHPVLRSAQHFRNADYVGSGYPDISWHGVTAWMADWSGYSRTLAFMLCGRHARGGTVRDDYVHVIMNMHWEGCIFEPPSLPHGMTWRVFANTGATAPEDIWEPGTEPVLPDQRRFLTGPRSVAILVGRA
jgi:glycogen operon protein